MRVARSLRATNRRMTVSYAFHTTPIAPSPMRSCSSNLLTRRNRSVFVIEPVNGGARAMCTWRRAAATSGFPRRSARGPVVDAAEHGARCCVGSYVPARQHALRGAEKTIPTHASVVRAAPRERGHVLGLPHRAEHAGARADHRCGAEQRADRRLSMVADQAPWVQEAGLDRRGSHLEADGSVRVLEVGRDGARAEVRPASHDGVSDEAVVRL